MRGWDRLENIHHHYYGVWILENGRGTDGLSWTMELLKFRSRGAGRNMESDHTHYRLLERIRELNLSLAAMAAI